MSTCKLAVALAGITIFAGLVTPPLAAQSDFITPSQLYQPGTTFVKHEDWGPVCIWYGQEPDGGVIYVWEAQLKCGSGGTVWGYDLNGDQQLDVAVWPTRDSNCGVQIRAWQWFVNGKWTEYVTGSCIYVPAAQMYQFVYTYFGTPSPTSCSSALSFLKSRRDQAYKTFTDLVPSYNTNRLNVKIAWHNYNHADLTLKVCTRQLAAGLPD